MTIVTVRRAKNCSAGSAPPALVENSRRRRTKLRCRTDLRDTARLCSPTLPICSCHSESPARMLNTHRGCRKPSQGLAAAIILPRVRLSRRWRQAAHDNAAHDNAAHDNKGRRLMARKHPHPELSRRKFLAGAAVAGAATAVPPAQAATTAPTDAVPRRPSALPPTMQMAAAESGTPKELSNSRIGGVPGSDFMVDVIKTLNIKYLPSNPASSFRGIHESLLNYGGNKMPEFLTCAHEESAVGMGHGTSKSRASR